VAVRKTDDWQVQNFICRCKGGVYAGGMTGDELLKVLATLANPHRLRVVAALAEDRNYVSALARDLGISRALLQVHLRKLESAGLVKSTVEVSDDGKAMKFYEVAPFALHLTPEVIAAAVRTLSTDDNSTTDKDLTEELR
jgi:predicted transcriptional regulator